MSDATHSPREQASGDAARTSRAVATPTIWREAARDRWLWLALTCGAVLRVATFYLAPHTGLHGDEREYYAAAAVLADGRGLSFVDASLWVRPPLYILLLGGLFRLFGPALFPVWIVQTALGLVSLVLTYLLARLTFPEPRASRYATLLAALYLPFAVYARLLLTETLTIALLLGALVSLQWWARERTPLALAIAGAGLGLASLTRGLMFVFVLVLPCWLLAVTRKGRDLRTGSRASVIVVGVALALIAPWTLRNAVSYHRFIPVETTGGYNFWLSALGGRGAGQLENALLAIPNQGDRQSFALRQGLAEIRRQPGAYVARSARELADLWRVNFSASERLTQGYSRGVVSRAWLALTLVLDDLIYFGALPLALLGWLATPRPRERWLAGLWISFSCAAGALFFSITRFRVPLMPFVFVFAGGGLASLPHVRRVLSAVTPSRRVLAAVGLVTVLLVVYPTLEPTLYITGFRATTWSNELKHGFALLQAGDPRGATVTFTALPTTFYGRAVGLALAAHQVGDDASALALLDDVRDPTGAALVRGSIAREAGDFKSARAIWDERDFKLRNPLDDAWQWLRPPPLARVDVGGGLDIGYVRGFSVAEREADGRGFRWTGARAEARLAAPPTGASGIVLRVKSYRPSGGPIPPLRVTVNGVYAGEVHPGATWETFTLPLTVAGDQTLDVELRSDTFVPGFADQRVLGCMVETIAVRPADNR